MADLNNIRWYLHRLVSMSPAEMRHRFQQRLTVLQDQRQGLPNTGPAPDSSLYWESFLQEELSTFFFRWEDRPSIQHRYKTTFQREYNAALQTAESLTKHTFHLFSKTIELGERISWQADPLTQKCWPNDFYASIDTRNGITIGGVKWVWELNRHHHFVTLGKAYFLSGDERFAKELCAQWGLWIEDNPPLRGINWTSSLELALRTINWAWATAFVRRSPALTETLFNQVMQSMAEQSSYISRHLSAHSSANNHLIGEAAGLAIVGLCYPWLPRAAEWRDTGFKILGRELGRQIHTDGVPAEQAISYLAFVLDFNLIVWQLGRLNKFNPPAVWHERLGAACEFIAHITDNAGHVPAIGDSDDAWVVQLDDRDEVNNYRSILASASVVLKRPDLKAYAGKWDEKSQWLLGEAGRIAFDALPTTTYEPVSHLFQDGGYFAMRAPGRVVVVDSGPLGYLSTAAHGHADALSLTVSVDGLPFLVDPGTYAYQEGKDWRDFFRSTAAHNTIVVDGQNQSEIQGSFLWGQKAEARFVHWQSEADDDICIAEHNGYSHFGVIHRRVVLFHKPNWLVIGDELLGTGHHHIEQFWHLHPACRVDLGGDHIEIACSEQVWRMWLVDIPAKAVSIHRGESDPIQGWYSPRYGEKEPATVIRIASSLELPKRFRTIFALSEDLTETDYSNNISSLLRKLNSAWEQR